MILLDSGLAPVLQLSREVRHHFRSCETKIEVALHVFAQTTLAIQHTNYEPGSPVDRLLRSPLDNGLSCGVYYRRAMDQLNPPRGCHEPIFIIITYFASEDPRWFLQPINSERHVQVVFEPGRDDNTIRRFDILPVALNLNSNLVLHNRSKSIPRMSIEEGLNIVHTLAVLGSRLSFGLQPAFRQYIDHDTFHDLMAKGYRPTFLWGQD